MGALKIWMSWPPPIPPPPLALPPRLCGPPHERGGHPRAIGCSRPPRCPCGGCSAPHAPPLSPSACPSPPPRARVWRRRLPPPPGAGGEGGGSAQTGGYRREGRPPSQKTLLAALSRRARLGKPAAGRVPRRAALGGGRLDVARGPIIATRTAWGRRTPLRGGGRRGKGGVRG